MRNTILLCLLTSLISASEPLIVKSSINDNFSIIKQEQVISKNAKKIFNPAAPSFIKNINGNDDIYSETGGTWSGDYTKKQNQHIIILIYWIMLVVEMILKINTNRLK